VALEELRSLLARRPAGIFDGAVLAIVTLAALFCCYEVEVFPADSKPHALELDELLLVSTIFCGGFSICALRLLAEQQRRTNRIVYEPARVAGRESVPPLQFDKQKAQCEAGTIENSRPRFEAISQTASAVNKRGRPTPGGRPSKNSEIEAAIDKLTAEGINLSKLPRKDAHSRICHTAATLGADVEVGFSAPVIRKVLVKRYGPRA
jgi:hypothetical protein